MQAPQLLLLDESTTGLDAASVVRLVKVVRAEAARGAVPSKVVKMLNYFPRASAGERRKVVKDLNYFAGKGGSTNDEKSHGSSLRTDENL